MNSSYVKKCTEFLQNIPAHKLAATNTAVAVAVGQPDAAGSGPQPEPQSKPSESIGGRATKKPPARGRQPVVGGVGKRPVWRHPAAGPVGPPRPPPHRQGTVEEQRQFVRTCCPARRPDSTHPTRGRVSTRWEEDTVGTHPHTHPTPARQAGRGDADNVNHRDEIGQTDVRVRGGTMATVTVTPQPPPPPEECLDRQAFPRWSDRLSEAHPLPTVSAAERKDTDTGAIVSREDCEEFTDWSGDDSKIQTVVEDDSKKLLQFHPLRALQFLSLELTSKLRSLGPEHRALYRISKELSIAVRFLSNQQQADDPGPTADKNDAQNRTQDKPDCPNCQLLQRDRQNDRDRHAQESAQLTEQINYLQTQLQQKAKTERTVSETVKEQYRRMEDTITTLKRTVDEKGTVEQALINDLKRNLKEARAKCARIEQERLALEKRLMVAVMENERQELFLNTQAMHFRKVKSELNQIHHLSTQQIEYLDDPIDALGARGTTASSSPRRHRRQRPVVDNYGPSTSSFECTEPTTTHGTALFGEPAMASSREANATVPSMASLASPADRDRKRTDRCRTPASGDDNGKDNECANRRSSRPAGINRADHDDNRIRHRSSADGSDYSSSSSSITTTTTPTNALHRKLTANGGVNVASWQAGDDKMHRSDDRRWCSTDPVSSTSTSACSVRRPDYGDKYGRWPEPSPVTLDDHQQFVAELAGE
uniref:Uncharacterized protein n=1 Tax=Anopheles farauti TaxID=69004 RepID=A0A182Q5Q0_9DIPT